MLLRAAVLTVLLPFPLSAADETFDLRGSAPVKGQIIALNNKTNYKNAVRTIKSGDRSIEDRFEDVTTKEKETEILAVDKGLATRIRIKIVKDVSEEIRQKGKRTVRRARENRLHGQVLFGELVKGEWKYTLDDVTPTPEQKKALKEYAPFRGDDELLPKKKVKVGESWKFGTPEFQKILGNQLRDIKASGSGKLLRVEKADDDSMAVIEFTFDVSGKAEDDGQTIDMKMSGTNTVHRSLKLGYDVKGTGAGKLHIKSKGEIDGQPIEMDFTADVAEEETTKVKTR